MQLNLGLGQRKCAGWESTGKRNVKLARFDDSLDSIGGWVERKWSKWKRKVGH